MAKRKVYTGSLEDILGNQILLNISKLKDGTYILKIMDENRVVKEITFIKDDSSNKS
jgi:hypothetical protein